MNITENVSSEWLACGPYAGGQMWRNQLYNCTTHQVYKHKTTDRSSISGYMDYSTRLTKNLITPMVYGGIGLQSNPRELTSSKTWLMPDFFGDPFDHQIHYNFYDTLKPCGFYHKIAIESLWSLIRNFSFIRYTVLSETRQINFKSCRIKKGQYISVNSTEDNRSGHNHCAVETKNCRQISYSNNNNFVFNHFDLNDIFISSYIVSNNIGLFILPSGSIFWLKRNNNTWTPCICEYEIPKSFPKGNVKINFREIDEDGIAKDEVIFCCSQREQYLHKTIAKMIKEDVIRIAVSNIKSIKYENAVSNHQISSSTMAMLIKNFDSAIFNQLKVKILQNTNIKPLKTFNDLVDTVTKKRRVHLNAMQYSKDSMLLARKEAFKACKNNTPIFWEIGKKVDYIQNAIHKSGLGSESSTFYDLNLDYFNLSEERVCLAELGYSSPSISRSNRVARSIQSNLLRRDNDDIWVAQNMYSYLKINPKQVKINNTTVNVSVNLSVTKTEICRYNVELNTTYDIPIEVKNLGEKAISRYIKFRSKNENNDWAKEIEKEKQSVKVVNAKTLNNEEEVEAQVSEIKVLEI
jgi:hypothetical protein